MSSCLRLVYVFLCVLFISSCASVEKSAALIDAENRCCKLFEEVTFNAPLIGLPFIVKFDAHSQAYTFSTGRSLISGFSVPESTSKINFVTSLSSAWIPSATVIIPNFVFLDERKRVIDKSRKPSIFQYYRPFKSSSITTNYAGTLEIPKEARYFIVYTDRSTIGKRIAYVNYEGLAGLQASPVKVQESEIGGDFGIVMSGTGALDLEIK
jgi:hypothetical protein